MSRYIVVTGRGSESMLQAYLYNHTSWRARLTDPADHDRFVALLETRSDTGNEDYLADYQAGRLQSGMFGTRIFEDEDAAITYAGEYAEEHFRA